jgi:hypothetical protein
VGLERQRSRAGVSAILISGAALLIALTTLVPAYTEPSGESSTWCLLCGERAVADAILNLFLFAPLGVALAVAGWRPGRVALVGVTASAVIEFVQVGIIPGRDASLRDLMFNSLGTLVGAALAAAAPRWYRDQAVRPWAAGLALTGALVIVLGSNVLTLPTFPGSQYFSFWNHTPSGRRWDGARVISASVGAAPVADGRLANSDAVRRSLVERAPIEVVAIAGDPVQSLAPLFSIVDDRNHELFRVGPDRRDLVTRYRMRGDAAGLDQPGLTLRNALRGVLPGDTLRITVAHVADHFCLRLNHVHACGMGQSAAAGWQFLLAPSHIPGWVETLAGATWLAALMVPFASWTRRSPLVVLGTLLTGTVVGVGALVPGVVSPSFVEWTGLPIGAVAGHVAGRWLSSRETGLGVAPRAAPD